MLLNALYSTLQDHMSTHHLVNPIRKSGNDSSMYGLLGFMNASVCDKTSIEY